MATRVDYGSLDFAEQIAFFRAKLNLPTERWADVWRDAHDRAFMVAGAKKADLLADLRAAVDQSIAEGGTLADFRKSFDAIVTRHGWQYRGEPGWRSRVIYETNLRTSYAAGRYAQLTDPDLLKSRPYWRYVHSDLVREPRPLHLAWNGLVLRHDDPWWHSHYPPNGWGCKCKVTAVGPRELRRLGKDGPDEAPDNGLIEHADRVTGEIHQVPAGIDPGWDYAPGRSVAETVRDQIRAKAAKLPPPLGGALRDAIDQPPVPPPPPPPTVPAIPMFSTVRGVDAERIQQTLAGIEGAQAQVEALARFQEAHGVKTVVINAAQFRGGAAARAIAAEVAKFLGVPARESLPTFTTRLRANGFTAPSFDHVTIKKKSNVKRAADEHERVSRAVDSAVKARLRNDPAWHITDSFKALEPDIDSTITTWAHEVGHQIHLFAGAPDKPDALPSLTMVAQQTKYEWHAEHFSAWLFNREALARWSLALAEYMDSLVERAIQSRGK